MSTTSIRTSSRTSTVAGVCGLCSADCGVALEVVDGSIRSARGLAGHPFTDGYICPKGRAIIFLPMRPWASRNLPSKMSRRASGRVSRASGWLGS